MKKLKSENPIITGILLRGGGQARVSRYSAEQNDLVSFCEREAGVDTRERGKQGAEHYVTAVVSENDGEANAQISQKHYMLLGKFDRRENQRKAGFTMAEILLSLTIIGVVAAITLPSLTGNINERTWNTQRKALYARFSQAIALMPSLNGYGTLKEASSAGASDSVDTATETFVTDGLAKVLKINNICDSEHLADCGIPPQVTTMKGDTIKPFPATFSALNGSFVNTSWNDYLGGGHSYSQINTKAAAFETQNGESIAVYYNPYCSTNDISHGFQTQPYVCANFVYDLNGNKGPNTVGKDIGFITVFNSVDSSVVAPMPLMTNAGSKPASGAANACRAQDSESRLPNFYEGVSLFVNRDLIGNLSTSDVYWTSQLSINSSSTYVTYVSMDNGNSATTGRAESHNIRCIKR